MLQIVYRSIYVTIFFFIGIGFLVYASTNDIKKKEKTLQKLRKEIDSYESRIRESEKKEKATLERLDDIEKQSNLIKSLISELEGESNRLQWEITEAQDRIIFLARRLSFLQHHYAQYVTSVYKFGRIYDIENLISSKSVNQLYIRIEYLKRFSEQRKRDLDEIKEKQQQLEQEHSILQSKLSSEENLIRTKRAEEKVLYTKKENRTQTLKDIREDKTIFKKELQRKTQAAKELETLISDLIEKERVRKEREAQKERERKAKLAYERKLQKEKERKAQEKRERELEKLRKTKNLAKIKAKEKEIEEARRQEKARDEQLSKELREDVYDSKFQKGKLPWPVSSKTVVAQFGEQVHPVLKTVTQNTGIDISVPSGTPVKAVADGEIALIHWLPSYGNLIIINHSHGFRTVYAHLSDISVIAGQNVQQGSIIAKSDDSVSGSLLHFEVWKDKEKQNPEVWLRKK